MLVSRQQHESGRRMGKLVGIGKQSIGGAFAPGQRVDRYELLEPLGSGGMAEVFRARTQGPGGFERQVVIKRILPSSACDPEFVAMFIDEAKILGLLHHPNVVQVYDFGDWEGTLFLVLELVDGPSLSRLMRGARMRRRPLPPGFVAHVAHEVCRALDYVHNLRDAEGELLGVVHRDVTPSNIVLTSGGGVKLLDFGVAKYAASGQLTRQGAVKGKPAYLAPEQVEGKAVDGRGDLFALGVVMHEMLLLEHLFAGDNDLATMRNVMEGPIPVPSSRRTDVSPELDAVVMKALARPREERFAHAAEMGKALHEILLAERFHLDEAAAVVREAGEHAPRARSERRAVPIEESAKTRRDLALPVRVWQSRFSIRSRAGLLWGGGVLAVAALALAVAFAVLR